MTDIQEFIADLKSLLNAGSTNFHSFEASIEGLKKVMDDLIYKNNTLDDLAEDLDDFFD